MIGILNGVLGAVTNFGTFMLNALIDALNLIIVAVGALIGQLLALLPNLPNPPSLGQSNDWIGWLNYYAPIGGLVAGLTIFVALWTTLLVVRIALKWMKAL